MEKQAEEKSECSRTELYSNDPAFGASWLKYSLQETLLPGKPWHKVLGKLEDALAAEVKYQLKDSVEREVVFCLLGQSFVKRYFSSCPGSSNLLSSGDMSERNKLEAAAKAWLQDWCFKAAERVHCQLSLDAKAAELAPEMVHFLNDIYNVVVAEMELLLAACEIWHKEGLKGVFRGSIGVRAEHPLPLLTLAIEDPLGEGTYIAVSFSEKERVKRTLDKNAQDCASHFQVSQLSLARNPQQHSVVFKRPKSIESKDIRLVLWKRPTSQLNGKDGRLHIRPEKDPPVLSCPESDLLGDLLCAILSQGSENLSVVCERLHGKLLPKRLRQSIWISKLLRAGSKSHKAETLASTEKEARVSFGRTVAQRIADMKLRTATHSPVAGLIENAVAEKYRKIPCMSPFATNEQMILETSKTLNVLYVFNDTYEPHLIYWLFPLQMAFQQMKPIDEHPYELAMYLHFLYQNLFPSWAKIHAATDAVMSLLEREDAAFFTHLQSCFRRNITVDPTDFLVEQVSTQQILAFKKRDQPTPSSAKELLATPVFFLRKWISEGFVSVLNFPAMMLVWDQFFMQDWNINVMQNFCALILLLLKESFMAAEDYSAVRKVFLLHPSRLLTADIQKAWIHLQQGGLPADVPGFNSLSQK